MWGFWASHTWGSRRGLLVSVGNPSLCPRVCLFPLWIILPLSLPAPCHPLSFSSRPCPVWRSRGSYPTPPPSIPLLLTFAASLPPSLCLPVCPSLWWLFPSCPRPTLCPLPRVFLRPFPGTVKASIVPLHFDKPQCCGIRMAFLRWLWAGRGDEEAGLPGPMLGCSRNPEKGRGSGGGIEDACARQAGPLRLWRKPRVASRSVPPPSGLQAPAQPTCPSDPCFLWGLRGACSYPSQAAEAEAASCLPPRLWVWMCECRGLWRVPRAVSQSTGKGKIRVLTLNRLDLGSWPHCLLMM